MESAESTFSFLVFIIVMTSFAVLLLLVLVVMLEIKMNRLMSKLDNMSHDAGRFLKMGIKFFRGRGSE